MPIRNLNIKTFLFYSDKIGDLRLQFGLKFHAEIHSDWFGYYEYLYSDYRELDREKTRTGRLNLNLIVQYDVSHLTIDELVDLMEKSLETGVNLLLERVKDKKVVITEEMKQEAKQIELERYSAFDWFEC